MPMKSRARTAANRFVQATTVSIACWSLAGVLPALAQTQGGSNVADDQKASLSKGPKLSLGSESSGIWNSTVGNGFKPGALEIGGALALGIGMRVLLSERAHDLALAKVHFGWMFTDVQAEDKWYRGNWELLGEIFGGFQYQPDVDYVVGIGPMLRYNLATRTPWVPFLNVGGGLSATSIRDSDLSTTFEYQLQGGGGTHYFVRENVALTLEYRFLHISNAGIKYPNLGVNTSVIYLGVSWFF